jgi:hypothetical protein
MRVVEKGRREERDEGSGGEKGLDRVTDNSYCRLVSWPFSSNERWGEGGKFGQYNGYVYSLDQSQPLGSPRAFLYYTVCVLQCIIFWLSYSTIQCSAVQCSAVQCSAAQHSTAQHSTAQHSTAQHSTAQHSTAQHSTAHHTTPHHTTPHHTTPHHGKAQNITEHHSTAQHSTVQYSTVQYSTVCPFMAVYQSWEKHYICDGVSLVFHKRKFFLLINNKPKMFLADFLTSKL